MSARETDARAVIPSLPSPSTASEAGSGPIRVPDEATLHALEERFSSLLGGIKSLASEVELASASVGEAAAADEQCTSQNWRKYLPYYVKDYKAGVHRRVLLPDSSSPLQNPVQVVINDSASEIQIWSKSLQSIFLEVIDVACYDGVDVSSETITLLSPHIALYHELERLRDAVHAEPTLSARERAHFEAMCYYIEHDAPQVIFKNAQMLLERGIILWDSIWILFSKGSLVVSKDVLENFEISRVVSVKLEEDDRYSRYQRKRWFVTTSSIVYSGGQYREHTRRRRLEAFEGVKRINTLNFYPLEFLDGHAELKTLAIERGAKWKQYNESGPTVMTYKGRTESLLSSGYYSSDDETMPNVSFLSATIIVDPNSHMRIQKRALIDSSEPQRRYVVRPERADGRGKSSTRQLTSGDFTDDDYMQCPATTDVFNLDRHGWYRVNIMDIKPKTWHPESFDRLVMDPVRKDILRRITRTSLEQENSVSYDAIEGKGKGLVLLLHGPPGVGKTMAAEVLAEITRRPLLKVNLGHLSTHTKWELAIDEIFNNGEAWKAILLIDEAEVVLEKRTFESMRQNSWISVFLRKLEYYQGVLILTTNLIDCMDHAFESRISYPVNFKDLGQDERRQIWKGFIEHLTLERRFKRELLEHVDDWSEAEINGRQIRNVFTMASNLAQSDEGSGHLSVEHINKILDATVQFTDFNQAKYSKKKKALLAY